MTILSKKNLAVLEGAAKSNNGCYNLESVKIEKDMIWSSNGHALYGSKITEKDEDYPNLDINGIAYDECMIVPASALIKAEKNLTKARFPILNNIQILIDENYKHLVTSDLDITNDVKVKHSDDNDWPDHRQIIESIPEQPESFATFGIDQLEVLVKVLKKNGEQTVRISLYGPNKPIVIKSGDLQGYIMPCGQNKSNAGNRYPDGKSNTHCRA